MKIAISISGKTLDSSFDTRFGRASAFCIVETETDERQVFDNPAFASSGGAGVQAAQFIVKQGAQAVVSGAFGPNAFDTLAAADVIMYIAPGNQVATVKEILDLFKADKLSRVDAATNKGHHGGHR
jgi:predicted Fe-Mo cluster-binding NifX family protein